MIQDIARETLVKEANLPNIVFPQNRRVEICERNLDRSFKKKTETKNEGPIPLNNGSVVFSIGTEIRTPCATPG
jgi:hypothetical protein